MTNHRARHIALFVTCSILAHRVEGQTLVAGERVRIVDSYNKNPLMQGTLVRTVGDSVYVASDSAGANATGTAWLIGGQNSLQRSAGMKGSFGRGVGVGLLVGAPIGAILGAATHKACEGWFCSSAGEDAAAAAILLGLGGMLVGGVIGSTIKHESWETLAGRPIQVGIAPTARRGIAFGAAVSF